MRGSMTGVAFLGRWVGLLLAGAVACCLLSCALVSSDGAAPAPDATETFESALPPATATPEPFFSATTTPLPSPNSCPEIQTVAYPDTPMVFPDAYVETLRQYLTIGGDPELLPEILDEWQARVPEGEAVLRADLTGDGTLETVVVFVNPFSELIPPEGAMVIYTCREGAVEKLYTYTLGEFLYPVIVGAEDLTADDTADLAYTEVSCGAHTCWYTLHVWFWDGSTFQERVAGEFTLPYSTFSLQDGKIVGVSGGIGSVGAGPQRPYTETWRWNGDVITRTTIETGSAQFRFHAFIDGDAAFLAHDYFTAFESYTRVLNDETLEAWGGYYSKPEERLWLTALARWRLLTLSLVLGNAADAEAAYRQLQADFTLATPGYPVAALAQQFWQRYQETGDVSSSCRQALDSPEGPDILEFLNSFGYANPTYVLEDLCLFPNP